MRTIRVLLPSEVLGHEMAATWKGQYTGLNGEVYHIVQLDDPVRGSAGFWVENIVVVDSLVRSAWIDGGPND